MKNKRNSLKNSIQRAMNTPDPNRQDDFSPTHQGEDLADQANQQPKKKKHTSEYIIFGVTCVAISLILLFFAGSSSGVDTSPVAQQALESKVSTAISAGTVLLADDAGAEPRDYVIAHNNGEQNTKIWVWDYAAEDGDYVQVLVNGTALSEPFMIKHKPKEMFVPAVSEVQIKGIRDGGGGITYAVRYEVNGTSYFNTAPQGEFNTYTLKKD